MSTTTLNRPIAAFAEIRRRGTTSIGRLDGWIESALHRSFLPAARFAIFLVYVWFGALKLLGLSPATPLAAALATKTIGAANFPIAFVTLAIVECVIGVLFLIPAATRIVIPLLLAHIVIVCSPLVLVPKLAWTAPFALTLEGQYMVKNVVVVALALGIAYKSIQHRPEKTRR